MPGHENEGCNGIRRTAVVHTGRHVSLHAVTYVDFEGNAHVHEFASRRGTARNDSVVTVETLGRVADGVIVLAMTEDKNKILVTREFRPATGGFIYGLPSGLIDPGETPEQAARRELLEETGVVAGEIVLPMPAGFPNASMSDSSSFLAVCSVPEDASLKPRLTPHEYIEPMLVTPAELRLLLAKNPASAVLQAVTVMFALVGNEKKKGPPHAEIRKNRRPIGHCPRADR